MTDDKNGVLANECLSLSENCLYTSTSLFIWLRTLRILRIVFIVAPLVCGALAGWRVLTSSSSESVKVTVAVFAFVAGLLPSIYAALKLDDGIKQCERLAGEFKNLQDRFRIASTVYSQQPFEQFEGHVDPLMGRLERARAVSYTAPEWCFKRARKKIKRGDYEPDK